MKLRQQAKKKLAVIVGSTASGKSELAVKLARQFDGEIISADSRQIYRGLNIGTGKIAGKWKIGNIGSSTSDKFIYKYKGIPHHCIDFVSPKKTFTVAEYKKCAERALDDITGRGLMPIIVGGTGFWINALVYNLNLPAVSPNLKLRKKLEKKNTGELFKILQELDPERAKTIEQKNPRRIIRAIEIARILGKVPKIGKKKSPYNILWIGLNPPLKVLTWRIKKRAGQMLHHGLAAETKKLLGQGVSKKRLREFGFEYRAVLDFIENKITKKELYEKLVKDTLAYARRQMTWWKRNPEIHWINPPSRHSNKKKLKEGALKFFA